MSSSYLNNLIRGEGVKLSDESCDARWCKMRWQRKRKCLGHGRAGSVELGHGRLLELGSF